MIRESQGSDQLQHVTMTHQPPSSAPTPPMTFSATSGLCRWVCHHCFCFVVVVVLFFFLGGGGGNLVLMCICVWWWGGGGEVSTPLMCPGLFSWGCVKGTNSLKTHAWCFYYTCVLVHFCVFEPILADLTSMILHMKRVLKSVYIEQKFDHSKVTLCGMLKSSC